jgi:hypothetical protein
MDGRRHDVLPPLRLAQAVRELVARNGGRAAAERIGVAPSTLARIAGRLPGHRPTTEFVARALGVEIGRGDEGLEGRRG